MTSTSQDGTSTMLEMMPCTLCGSCWELVFAQLHAEAQKNQRESSKCDGRRKFRRGLQRPLIGSRMSKKGGVQTERMMVIRRIPNCILLSSRRQSHSSSQAVSKRSEPRRRSTVLKSAILHEEDVELVRSVKVIPVRALILGRCRCADGSVRVPNWMDPNYLQVSVLDARKCLYLSWPA